MDAGYLRDSVIMATIAFGFVFFSTLAGFKVADIRSDPSSTLIAAAISAGGAFFMFLAGRLLPGPPITKPVIPLPPVTP